MSHSDSLSAGSSQPNSDPVGSDHESSRNSGKSLSVGHIDQSLMRRRKGKQVVSSSSSERTVENIEETRAEASSVPPEVSGTEPEITLDWVARPPLIMEHIPRVFVDDTASEIRVEELEITRVAYHIPSKVEIRVPGPEWRPSRPPVGWRCIFEEHLKGGFRFLVSPFVCDILKYFGIPLAQVVPNAIRMLIRFTLACGEQSVKPIVTLFRYFFFQMKRAA